MIARTCIPRRRLLPLLVPTLLVVDCRHDARITFYEGGDPRTGRFAFDEGLVVEMERERRFFIRFLDVGDQGIVTDDQTLLLYLSLPIHQNRVIDWSDPRVFLVWSSFATEFSGFLQAESLKSAPALGANEAISGQFVGTVRPLPAGLPLEVNLEIERAPVMQVPPVQLDAHADLVGAIEEKRNSVDNTKWDREDRRPGEPGTGATQGDPAPREHDRPQR